MLDIETIGLPCKSLSPEIQNICTELDEAKAAVVLR